MSNVVAVQTSRGTRYVAKGSVDHRSGGALKGSTSYKKASSSPSYHKSSSSPSGHTYTAEETGAAGVRKQTYVGGVKVSDTHRVYDPQYQKWRLPENVGKPPSERELGYKPTKKVESEFTKVEVPKTNIKEQVKPVLDKLHKGVSEAREEKLKPLYFRGSELLSAPKGFGLRQVEEEKEKFKLKPKEREQRIIGMRKIGSFAMGMEPPNDNFLKKLKKGQLF